jgi:hypothetical protein
MNPERGAGRKLAGFFAMLFGICMMAAGGLCTVTNLAFLSGTRGLGVVLLLVSIAAAIGGFFLIRLATRLLRTSAKGPPAQIFSSGGSLEGEAPIDPDPAPSPPFSP